MKQRNSIPMQHQAVREKNAIPCKGRPSEGYRALSEAIVMSDAAAAKPEAREKAS